MKKLTEKQREVLQRMSAGETLVCWQGVLNNPDTFRIVDNNREQIRVNGNTVASLINHGWIEALPYKVGTFKTNYTLTDEGRAASAPVSVATDDAPAWTPAVGLRVRIKADAQLSGDNRDVDAIQEMGVIGKIIRRGTETGYDWVVSFGLDGDYSAATDELEPAPDAAQTAAAEAVTVADLPPFAPSETDYANAMKIIDQQAEQIAALARELEAANAAADTERELHTATYQRLITQIDRMERQGAISQQISDERLGTLIEDADKLIDGLDNISPMEAMTRLLAFRRTYAAFTQELHRAEAQADAAPMIAALRQRDNGNRTSADNVLAMFGDDDEGTIA